MPAKVIGCWTMLRPELFSHYLSTRCDGKWALNNAIFETNATRDQNHGRDRAEKDPLQISTSRREILFRTIARKSKS